MEMSQSKLSEKVTALEATLFKIDYQLKHDQPYYSPTQILIWRRSRKQIFKSLTFHRKVLAAQDAATAARAEAKKAAKRWNVSYGHQEMMEA